MKLSFVLQTSAKVLKMDDIRLEVAEHHERLTLKNSPESQQSSLFPDLGP